MGAGRGIDPEVSPAGPRRGCRRRPPPEQPRDRPRWAIFTLADAAFALASNSHGVPAAAINASISRHCGVARHRRPGRGVLAQPKIATHGDSHGRGWHADRALRGHGTGKRRNPEVTAGRTPWPKERSRCPRHQVRSTNIPGLKSRAAPLDAGEKERGSVLPSRIGERAGPWLHEVCVVRIVDRVLERSW